MSLHKEVRFEDDICAHLGEALREPVAQSDRR